MNPIKNIINFLTTNNIELLVVHGLKSNLEPDKKTFHTHSFIHAAISKAFNYISTKTNVKSYWIDDDKEIADLIYKNKKCLIFTSPHYNTDIHIPISDSNYYLLHYCKDNFITKKEIVKYNELLSKKKAVKYMLLGTGKLSNSKCSYINNCNYMWYNPIEKSLHMPWATNLLSYEIDKNIAYVKSKRCVELKKKNSLICGSHWHINNNELTVWKKICDKNNIIFERKRFKNEKEHVKEIQEAFISPTIQGFKQTAKGGNYYLPCRIFKNISYGAQAITNNEDVYNVFKEYNVIYDEDLNLLMEKAIRYNNKLKDESFFINNKKRQIECMEYVKKNHTYINRINDLITYGFH